MDEDQVKFAFSRVKHDVVSLQKEILNLKDELSNIKVILHSLTEDVASLRDDFKALESISTNQHINSTNNATSTHSSTVPQEIGGFKYPNMGISIGNQGVSTDRQTDSSTDKNIEKSPILGVSKESSKKDSIEHDIREASEILDSLDRLKKEIRLKFKRVTSQEMAVFSAIYQLEEQDPNNTTYKRIADILKLSESSIRDYVQRMINKGIPIKKQKIDNKKIILSISSELKKIATLSTIIKLREL